jgi:hypothetical protein
MNFGIFFDGLLIFKGQKKYPKSLAFPTLALIVA